jgi:hypothetical protein
VEGRLPVARRQVDACLARCVRDTHGPCRHEHARACQVPRNGATGKRSRSVPTSGGEAGSRAWLPKQQPPSARQRNNQDCTPPPPPARPQRTHAAVPRSKSRSWRCPRSAAKCSAVWPCSSCKASRVGAVSRCLLCPTAPLYFPLSSLPRNACQSSKHRDARTRARMARPPPCRRARRHNPTW